MYLLTSKHIQQAVAKKNRDRLDISDFDVRCLQHTAYYFRLGDLSFRYSKDDGRYSRPFHISETTPLRLASKEYVRVKSKETFRVDDRTLGIIGCVTDLAERGISLTHSPFIDPLFPRKGSGFLELGLFNMRDDEAVIEYETKIGKVAFFDVSDTYPVELIEGSASEHKFDTR